MKEIILFVLGLVLFTSPAFSQQEDGESESPQEDTSLLYITKTKEYILFYPKDYEKRMEFGKYYLTIDSTDAAKKIFEPLIQDIIQDIGGKNNIEQIYKDIANAYFRKNNFEEGKFYLHLSIEIIKEYIRLNPKDYEKRLGLGKDYLTIDSTFVAKKIFEKLIQDIIHDTEGRESNIEKIYKEIAVMYTQKNHLIEAEFYFNLALEKVRIKDNIDDIIFIYEELARIYSIQSLYQEQLYAIKSCEVYLERKYGNDTLHLENNLDKYSDYRYFYNVLSDAYTKLEDYENALTSLDKFLFYIENDTSQEFIENDREFLYAFYSHNKGHALLGLGEVDSAATYLFRSLEINEKIRDLYGMMYDHWKIGDYYKKKKNEKLSNEYYFKCLYLYDELSGEEDMSEWTRGDLIECYQSISENYEILGNYKRAVTYERKAKEMIQKYLKEQSKKRVEVSTTNIEKTVQDTKEKERERILEARYNTLVYLSILFGILGSFVLLLSFDKIQIIHKYRGILRSMILLAVFEFFNLLLGPFFDNTFGNDPLTQFCTNFALSIGISSSEFILRNYLNRKKT